MIELKIKLDNIKYGDIVEKVLPKIIEELSENHDQKFFKMIMRSQNQSTEMIKTIISLMPPDVQEEIALRIVSSYSEEIITEINEFAKKKNLSMDVVNLEINKV